MNRYKQYQEWCRVNGAHDSIEGFTQWLPMQERIEELEALLHSQGKKS